MIWILNGKNNLLNSCTKIDKTKQNNNAKSLTKTCMNTSPNSLTDELTHTQKLKALKISNYEKCQNCMRAKVHYVPTCILNEDWWSWEGRLHDNLSPSWTLKCLQYPLIFRVNPKLEKKPQFQHLASLVLVFLSVLFSLLRFAYLALV